MGASIGPEGAMTVVGPEGEMTMEQNGYTKSLEDYITEFSVRGYELTASSGNTVQMIKPKRFSFWWALITGFIFYIPYYLAKRPAKVFLRQRNGVISGVHEYTKLRTERAKIGAYLLLGAYGLAIVLGIALGGLPTAIGVLLNFIALVGVGFLVASLFGMRRKDPIGPPQIEEPDA